MFSGTINIDIVCFTVNSHDNVDITDHLYYRMIYDNPRKDLMKLLPQHEI